MRHYTVHYYMSAGWSAPVHTICVPAKSKDDAWYKAVSEVIKIEGKQPYTINVYAVTFNNGRYKVLN